MHDWVKPPATCRNCGRVAKALNQFEYPDFAAAVHCPGNATPIPPASPELEAVYRARKIVDAMFAEVRLAGTADNATERGTTERIAMWSDELLVLIGTEYDAARKARPDAGVHVLGCDEAHQHNRGGMNCCALNCWCRAAARKESSDVR